MAISKYLQLQAIHTTTVKCYPFVTTHIALDQKPKLLTFLDITYSFLMLYIYNKNLSY